MAENLEPQHVLLNIVTASYLHSFSLQKCLFSVGLFCLFYPIPTAHGGDAVVPGDGNGPPLSPASLIHPSPGDPVGCVQWTLSRSLRTAVRDTLCSLCRLGSELGLVQRGFSDAELLPGMQRKGLVPGRPLTSARNLNQLRTGPRGAEVSLAQLQRWDFFFFTL